MMANQKLQKQALLPPRSPFPMAASPSPSPYTDHGPIARPQVATHHRHGHGHSHGHGHGHHQRTSSESIIEEQPSWLDDLLDEPETPVRRAGHRRSSSDSFALFDGGAASGAYSNGFEGMGRGGQAVPWGGVQEYYAKPGSFARPQGRPWEQGMPNLAGYRPGPQMPVKEKVGGHQGTLSVLRDHEYGIDKRAPDEVGAERKEGVLPKYAQSEADTKRAKQ